MVDPVIITGDDLVLSDTLKRNNSTFTINPSATVKASLVTPNRATVLIAPVIQSNSVAGADWANSLVVIRFTEAQTSFNYSGDVILEVEVDDGGKTTFLKALTAVIGTI